MFHPPDQRTLRRVAATLRWKAQDGSGLPTDPGTVTVSVASSAGTALVTDAATSGSSTAERTYSLAATHTAAVDRLDVTWKVSGTTVATTTVDVVGGFVAPFELIAYRFPGATPGWGDTEVIRQRDIAEDAFENWLGFALVPRFREDTIEVGRCSTTRLILPVLEARTVSWANVLDGTTTTALTNTELTGLSVDRAGWVDRVDGNVWTAGTRVQIGYTHGLDRAPSDISDVFIDYVRHLLTRQRSSVPERATAYTTPDGTSITIASPGSENWLTGIPHIDTVLVRHRRKMVGIR